MTTQQIEKKEKQIIYCIRLKNGKGKPYLYEFNRRRREVLAWYKEHQLYKPEYTIIKVEVKSL